MTDKVIASLPNAASLIESMRSIGYSFETAIADIIDNSISANAKKIDIFLRKVDDEPYIQILDDGFGMNNSELIEAMRLGSKNPNSERSNNDLGRFGLGMKSASFSQARKLTVVSKKDGLINAYQWDLDLVSKTEKFEIKVLSDVIDLIPNIAELEQLKHGTMIIWENFDRISDSSQDLFNELSDLMNLAIDHIALIFHRFIGDKKLQISMNNEPIIPKDPFLTKHPGTQERQKKKIIIDEKVITLQPYVLPYFSKLSAADQRLSGKVNDRSRTQGFYLYRNKRLIVWGEYLGLARKTELGKNLRIQVDIPNSLDYLWEIDVKKSRARIPSKIKKNFISAITDGEEISKQVNTYTGRRKGTSDSAIWSFISERDEGFRFKINAENELYKYFSSLLDAEQLKMFKMLSNSLETSIPIQTIYSQIAEGKEQTIIHDTDATETLRENLYAIKNSPMLNYESMLKTLLATEPYASNEDAVNLINEKLKNE